MAKRIKKGDEVVVIAGDDKGKRGNVVSVDPTAGRIVVEGVNMIKRHYKKRTQEEESRIIEREAAFDYSNVMLAERFDAKKAS